MRLVPENLPQRLCTSEGNETETFGAPSFTPDDDVVNKSTKLFKVLLQLAVRQITGKPSNENLGTDFSHAEKIRPLNPNLQIDGGEKGRSWSNVGVMKYS